MLHAFASQKTFRLHANVAIEAAANMLARAQLSLTIPYLDVY